MLRGPSRVTFPGQYLFPGDPSPTCEKAIRNIEGPTADSFNKSTLPAGPRKKVPASGQCWVSEDVSPICGKTMSSTLEGTADVLSNQLLLRGPRKLATSGAGLGGFGCNSRENGICERTVSIAGRRRDPGRLPSSNWGSKERSPFCGEKAATNLR